MNVTELKNAILSGIFNNNFNLLYSNTEEAKTRYLKACDSFLQIYGQADNVRLFSAPGRTEVGGNHTDHQHGRVLAGSVNLDVIAVVATNNDNVVRIKSEGYEMDSVDLSDLEVNPNETGRAISLIRGMCAEFKAAGYNLGGFNAYTTSNVLKGSGLSSSAAFEVLIGTVLNGMFASGNVSNIDIAKMGQKAESVYFGKPCGLLDQSASALGGFTAIDFADPKNPVVEQVNFDLAAHGYSLCVVNTGGNHANLTSDYADITLECRSVSEFFGVSFLREVCVKDFYKNIARLRNKCGDRAVLRAIHFFNEDMRAELEKQALKNNDFDEFLRLVRASGESSFKYLQNVYSNSAVQEQGISLALAVTEQFFNENNIKGVCRVHGGGFAGTIQVFLPTNQLLSYKQMVESVFGKGSCYLLNIRSKGGIEITK